MIQVDSATLTSTMRGIVERFASLRSTTGEALAEILSTPVTFDDVRMFVRFDRDGYTRTSVYRDDRIELSVSSWRPGQSTPLQAHRGASAFRVLRGRATQVVLGERDRVWAPLSVVVEEPISVHQLLNVGDDPLLTLHAHSPPLPNGGAATTGEDEIVVIGGGFSAVAVAYHLLRNGSAGLRIQLIEAGPWLGRGIAYGVESEIFRLNVPASKMSLDPGAADDFVRYAGAEAAPHAFLSRALYGRYVTERLAEAIRESRGTCRVWRDEAVAVTESEVVLRSGRRLRADAVVLATGLAPRITHADWHPSVVDAWDECALATLPRRGHLLLIGAGLSALDVVAFLAEQKFEGRVTLVSRRGLLPLPHEEPFYGVTPLSAEEVAEAPRDLLSAVRWVRKQIATDKDIPWQRAVDRLRPHVTALYRSLSPRDRARFVRHVRPYWDIFRHRAPADALVRLHAWEKEGRIRRIAGRVTIENSPSADVRVEISEAGGMRWSARFDAVVRCLGPALSVKEGETRLLRSLLDSGLARLATGELGIETTPDGHVVTASGEASSRIVGIGAVRRASHWETTSVPDIAAHARQVANMLLEAQRRESAANEPASSARGRGAPF